MPFDYEEYQKKTNEMSTEQLHKEWENYTRQLAGGATSTATSVLLSPFTAGISLVGLGLSAPRIHNARKKREIIEAGLKARGANHNTRKRDVIAPMAVAGTLGGLTLGLAGPGADMIAGAVVGHGMEYAATHAALDTTGAVLEHKHDEHSKNKAHKKLQLQYDNFQKQYVQEQTKLQASVQGGKPQPIASQLVPLLSYAGKPPAATPTSPTHKPSYDDVPIPAMHNTATTYAPVSHQQQFVAQVAHTSVQAAHEYSFQQPEKYLVTVPYSLRTPSLDQASYPGKSATYTHSMANVSQSTLPPQYNSTEALDSAVGSSNDPPPATPTMEEEILYLRMRLLQFELEKRQVPSSASAATSIEPSQEKPPTQAPEIMIHAEFTLADHSQQPHLHVETGAPQSIIPVAQQQTFLPPPSPSLPPRISSPSLPPRPITPQGPLTGTTSFQPFPLPSPSPITYHHKQQLQTCQPPQACHPSKTYQLPPQQQYYPAPPSPQPQIQPSEPQSYRPHPQFSVCNNSNSTARPQSMYSLAPASPLPQYQLEVQPYQSHPQTQAATQFQRQDSGYYSNLSTPAHAGTSSGCSPPSQPAYFPQYNPQQPSPHQQYATQQAPPSPSPSTASTLPPPPYFPPPPTTTSTSDGKGRDYFTQQGQAPAQGRQSWYGAGTQGWQWGTGR